MKCPSCGEDNDKVVDSRASDEGSAIRRRRECMKCEYRFTTFERIEESACIIEKRSGSREPFDRNKIINGVLAAAKNRPIDGYRIEELAFEIEESIRELPQPVSSQDVGAKVLDWLRDMDDISYLRFSSVYKEFSDVSDFEREVDLLSQPDTDKLNEVN